MFSKYPAVNPRPPGWKPATVAEAETGCKIGTALFSPFMDPDGKAFYAEVYVHALVDADKDNHYISTQVSLVSHLAGEVHLWSQELFPGDRLSWLEYDDTVLFGVVRWENKEVQVFYLDGKRVKTLSGKSTTKPPHSIYWSGDLGDFRFNLAQRDSVPAHKAALFIPGVAA